jgi:hypothetical protein
MLKIQAILAIAAIVSSAPTGASFAQYKGPPIIVQTPPLPPNTLTQPALTPTLTPTLQPPVAAPIVVQPMTPAPAVPVRP